MSELLSNVEVPAHFVVVSGCTTLIFATALAYILLKPRTPSKETIEEKGTKEDWKVVDKSKYPGGAIHVYYGTQTGTAESFAQILEREGEENGFLMHVVDLEDVEVEEIVSKSRRDEDSGVARAIFLIATYGEGEPTDNATAFYNNLRDRMPSEQVDEEKKETDSTGAEGSDASCLVGLEYCVFGLGNREYDHYNSTGKFFDHALEQIGGSRMFQLGLGDDNSDLEGDFEKWKENNLWPTLKRLYIKDKAALLKMKHATLHKIPESPYEVIYHDSNECFDGMKIPMEDVHASSKHFFNSYDCKLIGKYELRSANDPGSTMHLEIDVSNAEGFKYETADNLGILPVNTIDDVEAVAKAFGYDLDSVFSLKASKNHDSHGAPFPMPISIRECLHRYLDITSPPRRSDLKLLAAYATDPLDQQVLLRMASKEGKSEYREKILNGYVGLVQLLKLCPSIKCSLASFLGLCPLLHPRYYTISSSVSVYPRTVHLTVALTEGEREDGTTFKGVCSGYLASLSRGDKIRLFNRPSNFRLPMNIAKPVIMIGPGTGIAPMRAFLQERSYQQEKGDRVGKNILYFGCKRRDQDFIYEKELNEYQKNGVLNDLHLAFSRETEEKIYVQHLLSTNAAQTWKLMEHEGVYIYVCGGVKMGHDVSDTLKKIICGEGGLSIDEARDYLKNLTTEGRYVQELWA